MWAISASVSAAFSVKRTMAPVPARGGRAEHRAEYATRFQCITQDQGIGFGAGFERDDLLGSLMNRIAQPAEGSRIRRVLA